MTSIHALTCSQRNELRVELTDWDGKTAFAHYDYFGVSSDVDLYRLKVANYSGDAGEEIRIARYSRNAGIAFKLCM